MTLPARAHTHSLDDIKDMLLARIDQVVDRYAPPAPGSYTDRHLYFTLNPGRADRSVGSFCVNLSGPKAGRWNDFATGHHGDLIDLIALSLGLSLSDAVREARAFLGLQTRDPAAVRAQEAAAARARARRAEAERDAAAEAERRAKQAEAIYLSATAGLLGTPVERYLAGRGIDLRALPCLPGAIRYHAGLHHQAETVDPETGEVTTARARLPGMVAAIVGRLGRIVAVHRTYLAIGADGQWQKAALPSAKKVLGDYRGGSIRLSNGIGPRGGRDVPLAQCRPGTRVYIAEGIETALSVVALLPDARVLACISLSNMGAVLLPPNVAEVVLLSDGDQNDQARAAFDAAVQAHAKAGRTVRVWRSEVPGEDLNDALQRELRQRRGAA
jgi:hypothetical protein